MSRPRSSLKRPLTDPADREAVLDSARRLSPAHYEVVLLLLTTGIELRALARVTWREVYPDALLWRRPRSRGDLRVPLDAEGARAAAGFADRPRRSGDQLDRLVRASFRATGRPHLESGSAMTLRLTRCAQALKAGIGPGEAALSLSLPPAAVERIAEGLGIRPDHHTLEEE